MPRLPLVLTVALVSAAAHLPTAAAAQNNPPPEGAPPPEGPQAQTPPRPAPPPPGPRDEGDEEHDEPMRFRWGISGMGGRYFYAGSGGGIGGIDARFGVQINNMIGVYGQPVLQIGAGYSTGNDSASASVIALAGLGALVDFTFLDLVYVAIGPEYSSVGGGSSTVSTSGASSASAIAGGYFTIAGRAGVAFGSMKPDRRKAFTIGLDLRVTVASEPIVIPCLALGYESF